MIGSTLPLAEGLDQHPVHRATTLLRHALLTSTAASPDPAEIWDESPFDLEPSPAAFSDSPDDIIGTPPLAALIAGCPDLTREPDDGVENAPREATPEGEELLDRAAEAQLQNLVQAFYRRQRQASVLVACSVVAAFVLTLAGLVFLFSLNDPKPGEMKDGPKDGSSVAWLTPGTEEGQNPAAVSPVRVESNRAAKTASLKFLRHAQAPAAQVILANTRRPVALGQRLPRGSARYLLLRGLPDEAILSAGRQTGPGAWLVKAAEVAGLTVAAGETPHGDYPIEVYPLDAANGPQARHRLVLRVDRAPRLYAAGFGLSWPFASLNTPQADVAQEQQVPTQVPAGADASRAQAQDLLSEGDIAGARVILTRLARNGDKDAAYELALTYDREVLVKAGIEGIDGDPRTARDWYTRAARNGHAGAAERLKML